MSQQSELADYAYGRLSEGLLPASHLVRMIMGQWGVIANPSSVHFFVSESIACLLRHHDVEVGDTIDGGYIPWIFEPWDSAEKIEVELSRFESYFEDESNYVFRKKNEPNEALEGSRLSVTVRAISSLREGTDCASQPAPSA